jgi:hypothetical protein
VQVREPFNAINYFKNPMVLMMLFTLFVVVVLPKMMGGEEFTKQMEQYQKESKDAGGIWGMLKGEVPAEAPRQRPAVTGGGGGGAGGPTRPKKAR